MLWLNRPYAGQETELRVVNESGALAAVIIVKVGYNADAAAINIEVQRLEDDPSVALVVP